MSEFNEDRPFDGTDAWQYDGYLHDWQTKYGWERPEANNRRMAAAVDPVVNVVLNTIQDVFGVMGLRAIREDDPHFFRQLEASVREAFVMGMKHQDTLNSHKRRQETSDQIGRILTTMVENIGSDRSEPEQKIRILAAAQDIDLPDELLTVEES